MEEELSDFEKNARLLAEQQNPYDKECPNRHLYNEGFVNGFGMKAEVKDFILAVNQSKAPTSETKTAEAILKEKGIDKKTKHHSYEYLYASVLDAMEEYANQFRNQDKWVSVETPIEFIWEKTNEDFDVRFCKIMDYTLKIRWIKEKERWAWCLVKGNDLIREPVFLRETENEAKLIAENSFLIHLIESLPSPPKTK